LELAERVAKRFKLGPLAVPGIKSYELQGGPLGLTLDLDVPDPEQTQQVAKSPRGEVGVWVMGTDLDTLEDASDDILRAVSKFTKARAWWSGNWHQNGELWLRSVSFS
jgi:hypothetical protein